ncbi:MAG: tyrosine-type recombinase/integrase, partial [Candidatus Aenigmatarchaeota archaeon]
VSKEVIDLIKEYCEKYRVTDPKEKVFRHTRSWYYKILKKTLNALGIKKKRILHGFRHSFGIFGVKEGTTTEDLLRLQKLMAHSNIQTTIEYAKIKEMGEQELAEKISKRLKEIHSSI